MGMEPISLFIGCLLGTIGTIVGITICIVLSRRKEALQIRTNKLRSMEEGCITTHQNQVQSIPRKPVPAKTAPPQTPVVNTPTETLTTLSRPWLRSMTPSQSWRSTPSLPTPSKPWLRLATSPSWRSTLSRSRARNSAASSPRPPPEMLYIPSPQDAVAPLQIPPHAYAAAALPGPVEARFVLEPYDEEEGMSLATLETEGDSYVSTVLSLGHRTSTVSALSAAESQVLAGRG
ncbi:hypothetical protein EDC01DRAFT_629387 [Geopyxis carbonaria]|nr:hypothetical protein EDC01DRAFT_629387 [Geopyxis carbonaria]